jgi:glycylpeptide N-tetradecanoyltransferase
MHEYWNKQPVSREGVEPGEIDGTREVSKKTTKLPDGFIWSSCSLKEACDFLKEHYVHNGRFKLVYTMRIMKWSIDDSIAIRKTDTKELVGFISSTPLDVKVEGKELKMTQIDYLCVHSSYRTERFAPILITEIKRRANRRGIWQAIYTAVAKIPTPITKSCYWHRFLDVKHLVKTQFHQTNRLREKFYEIRGPCKCVWREMTLEDVPKVTEILQGHVKNFKIAPVITEEYVRRTILPIHSYVTDDSNDFISFYEIPYERADETYTVKQAYRFFIVGDVYNDAFLIAKNLGYHVFNSAEAGVPTKILEDHKFMKGNGFVHYYLYNWHLSESTEPKEIAVIIP